MTINKEDYIKLKKVGISLSFKALYEEYFGTKPKKYYLHESIGGIQIQDLKGYWWDVDEIISDKDFKESKPKIIKPILIIVHGRIFKESMKGRINKKGNVAYIKKDKYEELF